MAGVYPKVNYFENRVVSYQGFHASNGSRNYKVYSDVERLAKRSHSVLVLDSNEKPPQANAMVNLHSCNSPSSLSRGEY